MRKKIFLATLLSFFALLVPACNSSSSTSAPQKLTFAKSEYQIHSGERITVEQNYSGVVYSFAGEIPVGTELNKNTGEITFTTNTPNYSQVILTAAYQNLQSDQAIVTLLQNNITTELQFHTPIRNIIDGDYILVTSLNNTAITYSLETPVTGVSIDSMSGRVSYTSAAVEGTEFIVVASSVGVTAKEKYYVTVSKLAVSKTPSQTIEIDSPNPATYVLDFSNVPEGTEEEVIALMNDKKYANEGEYTYNSSLHTLVINSSFVQTFKTGENVLRIITSRNIITVQIVLVTKFIRNATDLQSINKNRASLGGYYVLENDIDLTDYLAKGGEGYNDNRGWNQIGIYHDLEEDPTRDSFTGTFDGNGHIISGYFEERADDLAHNEGLFGYVTNQGVIKNVGFVGSETRKTIGRNFIGGFVGFNEGTIKNCWSNVTITNKHEDKLFHSIGAFAGANTGIIDSCYTIGEASGDSLVGAFVGKNYGDITNCYSFSSTVEEFCGTEITGSHDGCRVFSSLSEMKSFDFHGHFDNSAWNFIGGDLPELKHLIDVEFINGLEIANKNTELFKGEVLDVTAIIHPNSLHDDFINKVQYSLIPESGSGITQEGHVFNTTGAVVNEFTVVATLQTEYISFSTAKTFKLFDEIETVTLIDDFPTYVEPGKQYQFNVEINPSTAPQDMTWEVLDGVDPVSGRKTKPGRFAFFTGNILTIEEDMMNFSTKEANPKFTVQGTAKNGKTVSKELTLRRIHYLSDEYTASLEEDNITQRVLCFYKDSADTTINFVLPSSADLASMSVYRFNNKITDYSRSGHTVKLPIKYVKDIPNRQLTFTFRCGTGNSQVVYRGYGCYIDHDRYDINDVGGSYISLGSASDFYKYFRMTLDDTDESKYENYDKTFVLTNDIDFGGADKLVAIGYYSTGYNALHSFTGTIYGFGHTISNAKFQYSERYFYAGPSDPTKKADPNTYRVGFFGYFEGRIYDVVFEHITSIAYNYGGCFAGVIRSGGYLENVVFINSKTYSANEVDYTIDDVVQGRIAATSAGTFVCVTYNGTAVGLVGK